MAFPRARRPVGRRGRRGPRALGCSLLLLATGCASAPGVGGGWDPQDAAAERRAAAAAEGEADGDDGAGPGLRLAADLFDGAGLLGIDAPFAGEGRFAYRRIHSDAADDEADGVGLVATAGSEQGLFLRLGIWQLDQGVVDDVDREARRLELGLGRAWPVTERLRLVLEGGLIYEGDSLGRSYPVPPADGGSEGLFGSDGGTFGAEALATARWRIGKVLELGAGLVGETLREDSLAPLWLARLNFGAFSLHYEVREGDDEPEWQVGLGLRSDL